MSALVRQLMNRILRVRLHVDPPPASLRHSLAIHDYIQQLAGDKARILHYNQQQCSVTKERLSKLIVLFDDLQRTESHAKVPLYGWHAPNKLPELTDLETKMFELQTPVTVAGSTLTLKDITRDKKAISMARDLLSEAEKHELRDTIEYEQSL